MTKSRIKRKNKREKIVNFLRIFGITILLSLFILLIVWMFTIAGCITNLPRYEDLEPSIPDQTSKIYDINNRLITTLYVEENRELIPLEEMPENLKNAVIATEDKRFYQHSGIDLKAILRAFLTNIRHGKIVEGGSTITQQYAENVYLSPERTFELKIKEASIAYQLEKHYSKDKILEMYLNTIYFGHDAYGVEVAGKTYFGKSAKDLNLQESALLAALINAPNINSPFANIEIARQKRNIVLQLMYDQDYITYKQMIDAKATPIELNPIKKPVTTAPYFVEYIKEYLIKKYTYEQIFKGGFEIYTTIDLDVQKSAEQAINEVLFEHSDPSAALVAIDPKTGYIKAMVGGKDFSKDKFNIAVNGKRQPGSTFKPFVLTTAIEQNISPSITFNPNGPIVIENPGGQDWKVENYGNERYGEKMNIIDATIHSVNVVYAQLTMKVGPENVAKTAMNMGIESPLESNPAIGLGGIEGVSPLDMASSFSTLANNGTHFKPISILRVTDSKGNIIEEHQQEVSKPIRDSTAYLVTDILKRVITNGTGKRANIGRPAAGKTGTTQKYTDAWFVGYTPELTAAVWIGFPEETKPMDRIRDTIVVGGTFPAEIWRIFMTKALENVPVSDFPSPEKKLIEVEVCSSSGLIPGPFCPDSEKQLSLFIEGSEPKEYCNEHNKVSMPNLIGLSKDEAIKILESLKLTNIEIIEEFNSDYPKEKIFKHEPAQNEFAVSKNGEIPKVMIFVSKGPEKKMMPDIIGLLELMALEKLQALGFNNTVTVYEYNNEIENGIVFNQIPDSGEVIKLDYEINIIVSKGPNPEEGQVPNVIGKNIEDAIIILQEAGFTNILVNEIPSQQKIGTVIKQNPNPEKWVKYDSEIYLEVSMGVEVPNVIGMNENKAKNTLEKEGFAVNIQYGTSTETIDPSVVYAQEPDPMTYLEYNSIVTIYVQK
jgi:penicillin-binding protein 1A